MIEKSLQSKTRQGERLTSKEAWLWLLTGVGIRVFRRFAFARLRRRRHHPAVVAPRALMASKYGPYDRKNEFYVRFYVYNRMEYISRAVQDPLGPQRRPQLRGHWQQPPGPPDLGRETPPLRTPLGAQRPPHDTQTLINRVVSAELHIFVCLKCSGNGSCA